MPEESSLFSKRSTATASQPRRRLRETQFMNANLRKMGFLAGISMRVSGMHMRRGWRRSAASLETVRETPGRGSSPAADRPGAAGLPPGTRRGPARSECPRPLDPEIRADRSLQRQAVAVPETRQRRRRLQRRPRPRRRQAGQAAALSGTQTNRWRFHDRFVLRIAKVVGRSGLPRHLLSTIARGPDCRNKPNTREFTGVAIKATKRIIKDWKLARDSSRILRGVSCLQAAS